MSPPEVLDLHSSYYTRKPGNSIVERGKRLGKEGRSLCTQRCEAGGCEKRDQQGLDALLTPARIREAS